MSMFYALMALCLSGGTLGQLITFGGCPDVQVQENFNITRNLGRWYEQARFYASFEAGTECGIFDYVAGPKNSSKVISTGTSILTGMKRTFEAEVLIPDPEQPAKLLLKIPMSPVQGYNNFWALGGDYDNWTVFFSCTAGHGANVQYMWIATRAQVPDDSVLTTAYAMLRKTKIDTSLLMKVEQKRCRK